MNLELVKTILDIVAVLVVIASPLWLAWLQSKIRAEVEKAEQRITQKLEEFDRRADDLSGRTQAIELWRTVVAPDVQKLPEISALFTQLDRTLIRLDGTMNAFDLTLRSLLERMARVEGRQL